MNVAVDYSTTPENQNATTFQVMIYWYSSKLTYVGADVYAFSPGYTDEMDILSDTENGDGDTETDMLRFTVTVEQTLTIVTEKFTTATEFTDSTTVNFEIHATQEGWTGAAPSPDPPP